MRQTSWLVWVSLVIGVLGATAGWANFVAGPGGAMSPEQFSEVTRWLTMIFGTTTCAFGFYSVYRTVKMTDMFNLKVLECARLRAEMLSPFHGRHLELFDGESPGQPPSGATPDLAVHVTPPADPGEDSVDGDIYRLTESLKLQVARLDDRVSELRRDLRGLHARFDALRDEILSRLPPKP